MDTIAFFFFLFFPSDYDSTYTQDNKKAYIYV